MTEPTDVREVEVAERQAKTKELTERLFVQTKNLYRAVERIPKCGGEFELYNSYDGFRTLMDQLDGRLTKMSGKMFKAVGMKGPPKGGLGSTQSMIDHSDMLCEKISLNMDDITRKQKKTEKLIIPAFEPAVDEIPRAGGYQNEWSKYSALAAKINPNAPKQNTVKTPANALLKATGKPQMDFNLYDEKAANADLPFKPILKTKHHARSASPVNAHPYEFELNNWKIPAFQLNVETPIEPQKIEEKPVKMITKKEELVKLVHVLNGQAAFAVDLEHHNYRSYRGFTCLIQISTRDKDYIVDPFPLWHEMHILNEPFTNPNILKVFHGAHWDMEWLQRDFAIYVVNMFDTQAAMRILEFSKFSLAHLVQHYCDVTLMKEFQKSDWRLRPLPIEHIQYARSDTHYLLYCYDMLRNELIKKDGLKEAYDDSKKLCLTEYKTPIFKANDYEKFLPIKVPFNNRQKFVVEKLWTWRDLKARRFDESTEFVLPKAAMIRIANDFPRTNSELEKIVVGSSYLLKKSLKEILQFIADASSLPLEKPQDKNESGGDSFDLGFGALKNYELMTDMNRITKLKGTLQTGLDFTSRAIDEELRDWDFKETGASKRAVTLEINKDMVNVFGEVRTDQRYDSEPKINVKVVKKVVAKQNDWATPYEHYEVEFAEAQKEAERKRKIREEEAKKRPKTTYTHLDPSAERKPFEDTEATLATAVIPIDRDEEEMEDGEIVASPSTAAAPHMKYQFDESQILTKKALKRKRKLIEKAADIKIGAGNYEQGEQQPKVAKQPRQNWTTAPESVECVDYDQYSTRMFSQRLQRGGHNPLAPMRGRGGRGRGGMKRGNRRGAGNTRPTPRSMSYGGGRGRGQ